MATSHMSSCDYLSACGLKIGDLVRFTDAIFDVSGAGVATGMIVVATRVEERHASEPQCVSWYPYAKVLAHGEIVEFPMDWLVPIEN